MTARLVAGVSSAPPKSSKSGRQERNKAGPVTNKVLVIQLVGVGNFFIFGDGRSLASSGSSVIRLVIQHVGSAHLLFCFGRRLICPKRSESASGSAHGRQSHQREKMAVGRWPRDRRLFRGRHTALLLGPSAQLPPKRRKIEIERPDPKTRTGRWRGGNFLLFMLLLCRCWYLPLASRL